MIFKRTRLSGKCLLILQDNIQTGQSTGFGCRNICILYGASILRAYQTHTVPIDSAERSIILQWCEGTPEWCIGSGNMIIPETKFKQ
ncbi:unnamed protein product [Leptidea sinapis]|uniref:Uncharacterized protein n=1 Tax=Leptidea sinapis TaxID=189913 RepID=A0A5E4R5D5_9NEOP|nr:unnamed protein product [Leptidea sinapis]